jgi:hypothetical protein
VPVILIGADLQSPPSAAVAHTLIATLTYLQTMHNVIGHEVVLVDPSVKLDAKLGRVCCTFTSRRTAQSSSYAQAHSDVGYRRVTDSVCVLHGADHVYARSCVSARVDTDWRRMRTSTMCGVRRVCSAYTSFIGTSGRA